MNYFKKYIFYIALGTLFFIGGSIFFLVQREWLIIQWVLGSREQEEPSSNTKKDVALRKKISLYYWKDEKFCREEATFVWFSNKAENLKHLVNNWLSFLREERVIEKRVSLETISLTQDGQLAYFSFDQSPLEKEWSIFKKWHFIEGLLRTIIHSGIDIKSCIFLVGHQEMEDDHLDFSQAWPVDGFLE